MKAIVNNAEHKSDGLGSWFQNFAARTSCVVGSKWAFFGAISLIVIWGLAGPYFKYSDTWQLVVNTATTIVTFLMVFLIQNTQNRDARAIHLKLDEIIRSIKRAHNEMIQIERLSDEELDAVAEKFETIRNERRRASIGNTAE